MLFRCIAYLAIIMLFHDDVKYLNQFLENIEAVLVMLSISRSCEIELVFNLFDAGSLLKLNA